MKLASFVRLMQSCSNPTQRIALSTAPNRRQREPTVDLKDLETCNIQHADKRLCRWSPERLIDSLHHPTKVLLVQSLAQRCQLIHHLLLRPRLIDPISTCFDLWLNEGFDECRFG